MATDQTSVKLTQRQKFWLWETPGLIVACALYWLIAINPTVHYGKNVEFSTEGGKNLDFSGPATITAASQSPFTVIVAGKQLKGENRNDLLPFGVNGNYYLLSFSVNGGRVKIDGQLVDQLMLKATSPEIMIVKDSVGLSNKLFLPL